MPRSAIDLWSGDGANIAQHRIEPSMSLTGGIALVLVAAQLLATAVFQFAPLRSRFHRLDYIAMLPRWRFFIPDGGAHDHAIAIRERTTDGDHPRVAWRTIWEMPPRGRWSWLWAPDRDDDQNLWFAVATLDARIAGGRESTPETSHSHAMIFDRCRRMLGDRGAEADHEFALMRIDANGERRVGFIAPVERS